MKRSNANTKNVVVKAALSLAFALGALTFPTGCDDDWDLGAYWNPGAGFRGGNQNQGLPASQYDGRECSRNPMPPWC